MPNEDYEALRKECEILRIKAKDSEKLRNQLQESEERHTRMLHNLPGMAYRCRIDSDLNYTLEFASRGSLELLGFTSHEMIRDNWNTIERMTDPSDLMRIRKHVKDHVMKHEPYGAMYRVTMSTGEKKWIWDQGEAVYNQKGVATHLDGIVMDVSAQKLKEMDLKEENDRLRASLNGQYRFGEMIGRSPAMQQVYKLVMKAAESDTNIIVYGETGTGKDLVARTVHELSSRKGQYVPVNCGAIPEQLLESEFFGHKRGAFSGANTDKQGLLAAADGGTLFLDELGELNLNLQVKLLRALESKQYTPVGETRPRHSDFRIIAATNRNLKEMVRKGEMRADFFYRIHVLPVTVPPLRERKEDIPLLMDHFLERFKKNNPKSGGRFAIPAAIRVALEEYDWPGNVRELQNVLDRYVAFGDINFTDIRVNEEKAIAQAAGELGEMGIVFQSGQTLKTAVEQLERRLIVKTLERCRWHKGEAADKLGLNIRTMQRKIRRYSI
ncbi:sigma-54 interaction domain-containing protein [Desulfobaculum bizertense]|uniref:Transcriptional regulator containing PAS, AAA-type ATPase, and DNA-binding Fis domains n=1 Tax=Desulfobaculum bizertense DSM 18034 TaxID=1121442 RepID=A0A1T4VQZ4_9BACT|nr:sigma 54-interacting transcriptional regulator [Desulfobaculum bizertense]SKA67278.1 Transcriptional regulator containing PAS, AAA-type ATPase, and DNA-binding Fis domains [Desulfobaculum bizertense DSM 18034]